MKVVIHYNLVTELSVLLDNQYTLVNLDDLKTPHTQQPPILSLHPLTVAGIEPQSVIQLSNFYEVVEILQKRTTTCHKEMK
jgi:hypothetical protein